MIEISVEVREALAGGGAVVALESTIIAHGLPEPDNLEVAREIERAVRAAGAVPATAGSACRVPTLREWPVSDPGSARPA